MNKVKLIDSTKLENVINAELGFLQENPSIDNSMFAIQLVGDVQIKVVLTRDEDEQLEELTEVSLFKGSFDNPDQETERYEALSGTRIAVIHNSHGDHMRHVATMEIPNKVVKHKNPNLCLEKAYQQTNSFETAWTTSAIHLSDSVAKIGNCRSTSVGDLLMYFEEGQLLGVYEVCMEGFKKIVLDAENPVFRCLVVKENNKGWDQVEYDKDAMKTRLYLSLFQGVEGYMETLGSLTVTKEA